MDKLIEEITASLLNSNESNFIDVIYSSFDQIIQSTNFHSVYIYYKKAENNNSVFHYRNKYNNQQIENQVNNFDVKQFPWMYDELFKKQNTLFYSDSHNIPGIGIEENCLIEKFKIKSFLIVPLFISNQTIGFLGLNSFNSTVLNDREISLFKTLSQIYNFAFQKINQFNLLTYKEQKFKLLFENANDAIFLLKDSAIVHSNTKSLELFEYTMDELIGLKPYNLSPEFQPDGISSIKKTTLLIQKVIEEKDIRFDWLHKKKSGEEFFADVSLSCVFLNDGILIQAIVRDMTEKKQIEIALSNSEKRLRELFNSSLNTILTADIQGQFLEANRSFYDITGYKADDLKGISLISFVSDRSRPKLIDSIQNLEKEGDYIVVEFEFVKKNGDLIDVEQIFKLITLNDELLILAIGREITDKKRFDEKLNRAVIQAEEKERNRLASDLHDDIGPILSSMKMYLNFIGDLEDKKKRSFIVSELKELVDESIKQIREISNSLSPNILLNHGLYSGIQYLIKQNERFLTITFNSNVNKERFNSQIESVYYRILKELINNTLKHADATQIQIELTYDESELLLKYIDNGKGFNFDKLEERKHDGLGIYSILNRIKIIKGTFQIETSEGKGFAFSLKTII